jgi:hypothetical protein
MRHSNGGRESLDCDDPGVASGERRQRLRRKAAELGLITDRNCRFDSKRLAGRLLCRACQPTAARAAATAVPA